MTAHASSTHYDVSIVTAVYNCAPYLDEYFQSILAQTYARPLELCIYDDGSTDATPTIIERYWPQLSARHIHMRGERNTVNSRSGAGKPKHRAIEMATGTFLCFLDADDFMDANRIESQMQVCSFES